jgi:MYXO-CTERM domain-containing protein
MRSLPLLRRVTALAALGVALSPLLPGDASAGWPPPPNATAQDLSNPQNWPNDPGYAFSDTTDGQWNFYSFIPSIATNVRKAETASGMSIDLAWRYTIGDDSVVLAITDSGIEWDNNDLIDKVWLNMGELQNHKPNINGTPCGGTGALAGFDCNGDGIFSVSDYAQSNNLTPPASPGHPLGDRNGNGILDAGDIIMNFSDGVDDDGNGYVDDIAGWDFLKDDNNPYDDTRYGHGTGEARDSSAATNNMIGDAGACPLCRFLPTRAGDSFITDVTLFGKAVVYATDNGARIIQCALGTINNNRFSQAALDYAYAHNVLAITSMADENSRHHNMPAVSNHTLPVHAIEYDNDSLQDATTFLAFNPCSNFGGHNMLSASGTSCSSEATGKLSGIAGLLYSAALKYNVTPPLTPGEAHSIFYTTTDDVDVPESEQPGSPYAWSQPGFDQRFGYGRINANAAVTAIANGQIPPDVDLTSPTWYTVLYQDQATAPIPIVGTVSAKRATSFDYVVQWAPGVQPLEDAFVPIAPATMNVPSSMAVGADGTPLAQFDITKVKPPFPADVDSPEGENDTAITVRIQATAHYGGTIGDVKGEARRTYYVNTDPTLAKGFPIYLGDSGEGSPKMADLDGDGVKELLYSTMGGVLHVFKLGSNGPTEMAGFPFVANPEDGLLSPVPTPSTPSYLGAPAYTNGGVDPKLGGEPFVSSPAIGDVDGDGKLEIVLSTWSGTIYVIDTAGKIKPGWPQRLPLVPSCNLDPTQPRVAPCMDTQAILARGTFAAPVLADLDMDGKLDIIEPAFDGNVYAFHGDGTSVSGFPAPIHYTGSLSSPPPLDRILTTAAVADFNGDGIPDILVGSNERLGAGGQAGAIYLVDGRGTNAPSLYFPDWPVTITSFYLFPLVGSGVPNSGVIGDFDGTLAAVMHGNASLPSILPFDPGPQPLLGSNVPNQLPVHPDPNNPGQMSRGIYPAAIFGSLSKAPRPNTMFPLFAQPSLGDIDQDGTLDVVASGGSLKLASALQGSGSSIMTTGDNLLSIWSGKTGQMLPASPMVLEDFTFFNSQAIADLNGDDYPEVITGSGGYFLHAFDGCGREPAGWPKFTGHWIISTPAVGDLDGDGKLEVAIGTRNGWLYVWHTEGTTDGIIEWESFHHDNYNTGNHETPLDQGTPGKKAKAPLTDALCMELLGSSSSSSSSSGSSSSSSSSSGSMKLDGTGGCSCGAAGDVKGGVSGLAALVGLGLAAARRRRRAG